MSSTRVGSLVHHARNRIAGLIGHLQGGETDAPAMIAELQAVAGQLASVMALLQVQEAEGAYHPHEVELEHFFADLAAEIAGLAPPHLQTTAAADFSACPFAVWTFDSQLVRLAVLDALANAWRHARRHVSLRVEGRGGMLHFIVRDDGPGFPPEWLAAGGTVTPVPIGTGHGLRLARQIAERHQAKGRRGRIECGNDNGAVFCLALP